jgi:hypothetical protein
MPSYYSLDVFQLIYASAAVFGAWGLGTLFKIEGAAERIFVGLGVIAAISVPILIAQPGSIRWVSFALVLVGSIRACFSALAGMRANQPFFVTRGETGSTLGSNAKSLTSKFWKRIFLPNVRPLAVAIILTIWLVPTFYVFESHDLIYFGWLPSLFTGNDLDVNFATPMAMGVSNSMPSMFLVPLANPFTTPDFVDFIALRAFAVMLFVFLVLRRISRFLPESSTRRSRLFGALGLVLLVWGAEWAYTMLISSFVPAIGLALITLSMLTGSRSRKTIFVLFSMVAVAKAPIVGISLLTLVFLASSKKWNPGLVTLAQSGTLIFASLITWLLSLKGPSSNNVAFSFMGFGYGDTESGVSISWRLYDWATSFTGLAGWIIDYPMTFIYSTMFFGSSGVLIAATALSFIWLISKYFLSYLLVRRQLLFDKSCNLGPLDIWVLGALASILFVRNGESLSLGHQAHSFILLSVPISILFAHLVLTRKKLPLIQSRSARTIAIVTALCLLGLAASSNPVINRTYSASAITLNNALQEYSNLEIIEGTIVADPTRYSRLQVIAAITNSKLEYLPNAIAYSQVDNFLVPPN